MEEVWKGIALSNLPPNLPSPPSLSLRRSAAAAFHDFLSGTFKDSHRPPPPPPPHSPDSLDSYTLSLRSANQAEPFLPRKRCAIDHIHQPPSTITEGGEERRWKKMIKNRESAARSRARKQAYTNELEMEVAHLVQENAALKREQEELKMVIAAQATSKGKLQRASSSPI